MVVLGAIHQNGKVHGPMCSSNDWLCVSEDRREHYMYGSNERAAQFSQTETKLGAASETKQIASYKWHPRLISDLYTLTWIHTHIYTHMWTFRHTHIYTHVNIHTYTHKNHLAFLLWKLVDNTFPGFVCLRIFLFCLRCQGRSQLGTKVRTDEYVA